jgi:transmembrane sensor
LVTALSSDDRPMPVEQAAAWLARLHADDHDPTDEAAFRAWLAQDAAHAEAFERASAVWETVGGLDGKVDRTAPRAMLARRSVLAGVGAAAIGGVGLFGWQQAYAGVYETKVGEQRRIALDDGSRLLLDTATELRVRMHADRRELRLRAGRVALEVAADARPFAVSAGSSGFVARAGRFDVRCDAASSAIVVTEGSADVTEGMHRRLDVGERLRVSADRDVAIDRPALDDLLAWQAGRAVFRDQDLAGASAEMNRYTERKLVVGDPRAAQMRVSGVFRVGDSAAFARSVALLLPVRVDESASEIRITAN